MAVQKTKKIRVNEVYYSLQGEGARAGEATIFIRLQGCDLACSFCDTEFESGQEMDLNELYKVVKKYPGRWITWTGGEPMLQLTEEIVKFFRLGGYKQSLETNGNHSIPFHVDWLVISPKVAEHVVKSNIKKSHTCYQELVDELRYPWHSGKLGVPVPEIEARYYYLSPLFDGYQTNKENIRHCLELCKKHPRWRLSVQGHKIWNIL